MSTDALLSEISDFCRSAGLAESTFGRAAINDGKLVSRLRNGGRITTDTLDRLRAFMSNYKAPQNGRMAVSTIPARDRSASAPATAASGSVAVDQELAKAAPDTSKPNDEHNFRF